MKKLTLNILLLLLVFVGNANAQVDPHFSQYYAYPLWLNPALTGVMDGDLRVTGNFKDQWATISNGYRTGAVSGDLRTSEKVALGFNIINQSAGTAGYNYLAAYGSFAYQIPVSSDKYQRLSFGLQAGMINRSFDASKLQLDNQYNPTTGFDPSTASFEAFSATNSFVFDASAGIFYYNGDPASNLNFFAGASASHLASANDAIISNGLNSPIPMRVTAHGGARIRASEMMDLTPHLIYINQQKNQLYAAGLNVEFKFQEDHSLILGGMYRVNDAAVANVGFHLGNMMIGLSYDQTTSPLKSSVNSQGAYELSLSYVIRRHLSNRQQICPRL